MAPCHGAECSYGFLTVTNAEVGEIHGAYKTFIEIFAFFIFAIGVTLNTGVLTILISVSPNLDHLDSYFMSLTFGELISSFGLAFLFFVEFTTSLAPIGDAGCQFLTWLDVTSVTITVTSLLLITYELHHQTLYNRPSTLRKRTCALYIFISWAIAALPGFPYMISAKMGSGKYCYISHWSHDAEILYICFMLIFQVLLPVALLVFFFVRILSTLRAPREGDTMLSDETNPGSEASFQRGLLKRKVLMTILACIMFFIVLIVVSLVELSMALNVNNIEDSPVKYARLREGNSLLECTKVVFIPLFLMCYYDKLRNQFRALCCCRRYQEAYNSLSLRYNVYQQTVHDPAHENGGITHNSAASAAESNGNRDSKDVEIYETERDDVAILDNAH